MSNETLNIVITSVIVPIAVALVPLLIAYINAKTAQAKKAINNADVCKYVDIASDAVKTAVGSVFQTYVDTLKKEGNWNEKTKQIAFNEAKTKAMVIMGDTAKEVLTEAYGDLNAWIDNKIEYYVSLDKKALLPPQ